MIKLVSVIYPKKGISHEEFSHYWRNDHVEVAKKLPRLKKYTQNHVLKKLRGETLPSFVGFVELWFETEDDLNNAFASDIGKQLLEDEKHFISTLDVYSVDEVFIIE